MLTSSIIGIPDNQEFPPGGQPHFHGVAGVHPPLGAGEGDREGGGARAAAAGGRAVAPRGGAAQEARGGQEGPPPLPL